MHVRNFLLKELTLDAGGVRLTTQDGHSEQLTPNGSVHLVRSGWLELCEDWEAIAARVAKAAEGVAVDDHRTLALTIAEALTSLSGCFFAAVLLPTRCGAIVARTDCLGRHPLFYRACESDISLRIHRPSLSSSSGGAWWWQHGPRSVVLLQRGLAPEVLCRLPLLPHPAPLPSKVPTWVQEAVDSSDAEVERGVENDPVMAEYLHRLDIAVARALDAVGCSEGRRRPVAVLFSGGVDSTTIAALCKRRGVDVRLFTAGFWDKGYEQAEDVMRAREAAEWLGVPWSCTTRTLEETRQDLAELAPLLSDLDVVKVGVALTFSAACRAAAADGAAVALSGGGSEELLSGYFHRHLNRPREVAEAAGLSGLRSMYHRDLQRDFAVGALHDLPLLHPYLDGAVAPFAVALPPCEKVAEQEKALLRNALRALGAPLAVWSRRKRAAQYGSRFHVALEKLAKRAAGGPVSRADFIFNPAFGGQHCDVALAYTSGKESAHAYHTMCRQHCRFTCVLGFARKQERQDEQRGDMIAVSDHLLDVPLPPHAQQFAHLMRESAELFAACVDLPAETTLPVYSSVGGNAAPDLAAFAKALRTASLRHGFTAVVTGHSSDLASLIRLEEACDLAGLKCISPVGCPTGVLRSLFSEGAELLITRTPLGCAIGPGAVIREKNDLQALQQTLTADVPPGMNMEADFGHFDCLPIRAPFYAARQIFVSAPVSVEDKAALAELNLASCCQVLDDADKRTHGG